MADAEIMKAIRENPLCTPCIAAAAGVSEVAVLTTIREVAKTLVVVTAIRPCRGCHQVKTTYTVHSRQ